MHRRAANGIRPHFTGPGLQGTRLCPAQQSMRRKARPGLCIQDRAFRSEPRAGGNAGCTVEEAVRNLGKAMREDADLVAISRFSAFEKAIAGAKTVAGEGVSRGIPFLTSISGRCVGRSEEWIGQSAAMLHPNMMRSGNGGAPNGSIATSPLASPAMKSGKSFAGLAGSWSSGQRRGACLSSPQPPASPAAAAALRRQSLSTLADLYSILGPTGNGARRRRNQRTL